MGVLLRIAGAQRQGLHFACALLMTFALPLDCALQNPEAYKVKEDIARLQRRIKSGEKVGGWVGGWLAGWLQGSRCCCSAATAGAASGPDMLACRL